MEMSRHRVVILSDVSQAFIKMDLILWELVGKNSYQFGAMAVEAASFGVESSHKFDRAVGVLSVRLVRIFRVLLYAFPQLMQLPLRDLVYKG